MRNVGDVEDLLDEVSVLGELAFDELEHVEAGSLALLNFPIELGTVNYNQVSNLQSLGVLLEESSGFAS